MCGVVNMHSWISIICRTDCIPDTSLIECVGVFRATSRSTQNLLERIKGIKTLTIHGQEQVGPPKHAEIQKDNNMIHIRRRRSVVDNSIVHRPKSFVGMLVCPDLEIYSMLIKQLFQTIGMNYRDSRSDDGLKLGTIIAVLRRTIHRPVSHRDYPRNILAVLVCLLKILYGVLEIPNYGQVFDQPIPLIL